MHVVGLCLPRDFVDEALDGGLGRGQQTQLPGVGITARGREISILCHASMAGPVAETLKCCQVTSVCFS